MANVSIPVNPLRGNQVLQVVLDNKQYQLILKYNRRGSYWSLGVAKPDGTQILDSTRIVSDYSLLSRFTSQELPPGRLFCLDLEKSGNDPDGDTLGRGFVLVYEEA